MTFLENGGPSAAERVAERLKAPASWEVFADEAQRYEVHLNGTRIELVRGPISIEGYGLRVLRPRNGKLGTGFQASSDLSDDGIRSTLGEAETVARHAEFPAASVGLPSSTPAAHGDLALVDRALWEDPAQAITAYLDELRSQFAGRQGVALSFGAVRTTRLRSSVANSSGLRASYTHTLVELELAVKASGGPEGAPPGEYWVNESHRRLPTEGLGPAVDAWCRYAADVRRSSAPPSGDLPVVLPPGTLSEILPSVLGFRCSGVGRLRGLAPDVGSSVAAETVSLYDDGAYPWSPDSGPFDAEGTPSRRSPVVVRGTVRSLLYDSVHAAAFATSSTGNATRSGVAPHEWLKFRHPPFPDSTTLIVPSGDGGTDDELCEAAGDGIWVQQFGWAVPDPISGAFGGEIRVGYRIRHGKLAEPVRGGIVGGLVIAPSGTPSLLANVAAIGSHVQLAEGLAAPPLLVRPLTVAGSPTS